MKTVLYPGTFDPITVGHYDLIKRAAGLSETLVVAVIRNPSKNPMYTVEQRMEMIGMIAAEFDNVKVDSFAGLLVDYAKTHQIDAVVRGLRASMDFEYEIQMAQVNAKLYNNMETVFLMTDPKYSFVSSSLVREIFELGGDIEGLVAPQVLSYMKKNSLEGLRG